METKSPFWVLVLALPLLFLHLACPATPTTEPKQEAQTERTAEKNVESLADGSPEATAEITPESTSEPTIEKSPEATIESQPEPNNEAIAEKTPETTQETGNEANIETQPEMQIEASHEANAEMMPDSAVFQITSTAFQAMQAIPTRYGCDIKNGDRNYKKPSLPLMWSHPPTGTQSFVLLMDDLASIANKWVHWIVTDIPASSNSLPEDASGKSMPTGAKELENTFGDKAYGGPCPPVGPHTYRIRLFAMPTATTTINTNNQNGDQIAAQLQSALGVAEIQGTFP